MKRVSILAATAMVLTACAGDADTAADDPALTIPDAGQGIAPAAPIDEVTVDLVNGQGESVGAARLTQEGGGVHVAVRVTGLEPGEHGFHVHETGSCELPDFTSAGGHFSPLGRQHGTENPQGPHAGDMPNIRAGEDGTADTTFVFTGISMRADAETSIFREGGTALVVHEGADDYATDPSGDAGARVACGVIELR